MKGLKRLNRKKEKIPVRYSMSEIQRMANESGKPIVVKKARPRGRRKIMVIEPMSFDQAKERVSEYMRKKGTAATDELYEKLHIDLGLLVYVLHDLEQEGHIRERPEVQGE